jgi:hypothetical protein
MKKMKRRETCKVGEEVSDRSRMGVRLKQIEGKADE